MRQRVMAFVVIALMALCGVRAAYAAPAVDVFGLPVEGVHDGAQAASSTAAPPSALASDSDRPSAIPEPLRRVIGFGIVWQGRLNARIERATTRLREGGTPGLWWTLILMSFGYGVLHAVGPGHGKIIVGAYIGSRHARLRHALVLSGWTATVQALSAILIVFVTAAVSEHGLTQVLSRSAALETVGYGLLTLAGLWTLWTSVTRRGCCETLPTVRFADLRGTSPSNGHDVDTTVEARYLGATLHARSRVAGSGTLSADPVPTRSHIAAVGLAAGIRPCVGAIFVLIASIAAGIPGVGIAATFAMAAGVALTVSAIAMGSAGINRLLVARNLRYRPQWNRLQRVCAIAGTVCIVLYGATELALLMSGYLTPSIS